MTPIAPSWVIVAGMLSVLFVGSRVQAFGVTRDWFPMWVGRKVAHVGFGAMVLFSWTLFPEGPESRWYAASPALVVAAYFLAIGLGWVRDPGTVKAGSRSGTPRGLLRGPIFYSVTFVVLTLVFWRNSPVAMAALGFMTLGDGSAEVAGKTIRSPRLPWSPDKSVAGSLAAFLLGWCGGVAGLWLLVLGGWITGPLDLYLVPMIWVALAGAAVESLHFPEIDNANAALAAAAVGMVVF